VYERYFQFGSKPFAMNPDPAFLYQSSQHAAAATMLDYAIEAQAPFCLLTGEIGSGKTTLLRHFLRRLSGNLTVGLISNTHGGFRSIHPWALSALGVVPSGDSDIAQYEALIDFFVGEYGKGRRTLLVFDEAHNLSLPVLEELRLLSNVNSESDLALQVLLVGQPELRAKLQRPELEQFAQRVSVDFHLGSLTYDDTRAYIQHRLTVARGNPSLFHHDAMAFIHVRTQGIPRLINQLCDLALVYAYAEQQSSVDLKLLQHVVSDRQQRGSMPLFVGAPAAPGAASSALSTGATSERG
jgi:type II secretory pathway predicted ATPase ExeA